ncbi:MAG: pyrroline-5-carboxylate reductase, partial [Peptococcaceae bacterium]|nr:pyrroline-5-carboxylate reductase [Peptococcaceae bacterium]
VRGLIQSNTAKPQNILVTGKPDSERVTKLVELWGVARSTNREVADRADVIIIAVKPKDVASVMEEIGFLLQANQLVISVAAGIPTAFIEGFCSNKVQVIRSMPNTSSTVLASATAVCKGKYAGPDAEDLAVELFASVGMVQRVNEEKLDVITGLSGSGPAYVYLMIEALGTAGVQLGLDEDMALALATQTVFGAAKMLLETGENPSTLRQAVSSPGGTTLAGLKALAAHGFNDALREGVKAATNRAREMGLEYTGLGGGAQCG